MAILQTNVSTLCTCMKIVLKNGTVLGFSSLYTDLSFGGVLYKAVQGLEPTASSTNQNLTADNIEVKLLADNGIAFEKVGIINGLYDDADVIIALVDFVSLPSQIELAQVIVQGKIGQITHNIEYYTIEIRTLADLLSRPLNYKVSPSCIYSLGDGRCQLSDATLTSQGGLVNTTVVNHDLATGNITLAANVTGIHAGRVIGGALIITSGMYNAQQFTIKNSSGNTVVVDGSINTQLPVGTTVTVRVQCGKLLSECTAFSNADNFGGFLTGDQWIPGLDVILIPS